jgi:hypothetical protein
VRDRLAFGLAIENLFDARVVAAVQLMKAEGLTARGGAELHGEGDHTESDMTFPNAVCHDDMDHSAAASKQVGWILEASPFRRPLLRRSTGGRWSGHQEHFKTFQILSSVPRMSSLL